jgi:hypothetical protein
MIRSNRRPFVTFAGAAMAIASMVTSFMIVVPTSAQAAMPAPIRFDDSGGVVNEPSGCPGFPGAVRGTANASGAVTDVFALSDCFMFGGSTLHIQRRLDSANGTIGMTINARRRSATATSETFAGTWAVVSGSGAYSTLSGQGTFTATVDRTTETSTETLLGQAELGA